MLKMGKASPGQICEEPLFATGRGTQDPDSDQGLRHERTSRQEEVDASSTLGLIRHKRKPYELQAKHGIPMYAVRHRGPWVLLPRRHSGRFFSVCIALVGVLLVSGCSPFSSRAGFKASASRIVRAGEEATVSQEGASLHLPAGSLDRDTTVRISRATDSPGGVSGVEGFDFDIGDARILMPVVITLPVTGTPVVGPKNLMLVPFHSSGGWGAEVGSFDPGQRVVRVTVQHLSWYTVSRIAELPHCRSSKFLTRRHRMGG